MVEKKKTQKNKIIAKNKKKGIRNIIGSLLESIEAESPKDVKSFREFLNFFGFFMFALFLLILFVLLLFWDDISIFQNPGFFQLSGFLETLLIVVAFSIGLAVFLNRIIRSRAEQREEDLRKKLRKIDYDINLIYAKYEYVDDRGEEQQLSDKLTDLKLARAALIIESPQGWKQDISTKWGITLVASYDRLLDEGYRLRKRNRINLVLGIIVAFIGASFFIGAGVISYYDETLKDLSFSNFPFYYLLCIPITVISEVLAIFFLRLYAQTEKSIERNKNELTNIELRLTASQLLEDKEKFAELADTLSKEERNFVLGKNESTGGISANKLLETLLKLTPTGGG